MSADAAALPTVGAAPRGPATWYSFLLTGFYIYTVNVQGNVVPFLQAEFALSYRAVSLHSSAIALGIILVGLAGDRVVAAIGRRRTLWVGVAGLGGGSILLCLAPAPLTDQLPWASIGACFLIGALGALVPALVPAILADLHGERRAAAYAGQAITAYSFGLAAPLVSGFAIWAGLGWRAAVLFGALVGIGIALWFRKLAIAEAPSQANAPARDAVRTGAHLPPAFWAYWLLLFTTCAVELSLLFWAPAFLERVAGFAPAAAALAAAGFPLGMLLGRIALRLVVRRMRPRRLLLPALGVTALGFALYWGLGSLGETASVLAQPAAILGVFLLGLGIAPLYPLSTEFAIGAVPAAIPGARDLAAMRMAIGIGLSLLLAPIALGGLADEVGLGLAHLALPGLVVAAVASFLAGEALLKRAAGAGAEA